MTNPRRTGSAWGRVALAFCRGRGARVATSLGWFIPLCLVTALAWLLSLRAASPQRLSLDQVWAKPSADRPLGSAEGGVDVATFLGHACIRVLLLAVVVSLLACLIGAPLGALAAMKAGRTESATIRCCDLFQSFPSFLLALSVLSTVEAPARWHLGLVFLMTAWAPFARMAHAQARWVSNAEFVLAAKAMGAPTRLVIWRHFLPHLVGPLSVQLGSCAAGIVLSESALGFVGLGPGDGVSLGALLEQGTVAMLRDVRVMAVAAAAIVATSGSLQLASEGLRRRLVPR